ncbi:formate dehydrogenase subunit alpha [Dissulfurispira thermophila]|uniref:Formate dehydrogenase subunit alpha n=2 Tax=root TaxID=1 RepID=A0A7G1H2J2_9BACT|nr:molybdopterin-dependent oxidoreductase [Dissulfurispira thermophila]BCB97024.1 formate dehydrogenase subunit alpha [Dissulfurispira thermophila]
MITVTIDGKKITLQKAITILKAAEKAGIKIPTLCHHDMLEPYGGCRLCLVEIEKMPRLQTACTQYVADGMVIWTETERVVEARKGILEFLLINHPLDCPYCDKAGECDLQDLVVKYGPSTGRFVEGKRTHPENYDDPIIVRNMERCILCARCVRMCDKVQGASAISITNRSSKSFVEPFSGGRYNCEYCGNCLTVCPVGAIMSRLHKHTYRPWQIEKEVDTVCSFCGVGCSLTLQVRGNSIVRAIPVLHPKGSYDFLGTPRHDKGLNKGLLCNRGRFGYDYVGSKNRLDSPLIKKDGEFKRATWDEAFSYIASRLKEIKDTYGSNSIAGIASGRCTNEDNYVFQKFMRVVLGTNNIDSVAGFAYAQAQKFFENIFGQGVTANPIHGIANSDGIFVVGGDPTSVNPVLGLQIRAGYQKAVPVITMGYANGLKIFSSKKLIPHPFTETALLLSLITGIRNERPLCGLNSAFEKIIRDIPVVEIEEAQEICGIASKDINYAIDTLSVMTNPAIIIGRDIIQKTHGHTNLLLLAALIYLLNGRIYLLSELPNEQGLVDMGCLPDMLLGGRPMAVDIFRKRYEEFFGVEVSSDLGYSLMEMIDAAHHNKIKAMYVIGDDAVSNLPNRRYVSDALSKLDFLVVHDVFMTDIAYMADVVIPSLSWAEKEGSYTNLERRLQMTKKAVDGIGIEDWKAIANVSRMLGFDMDYRGFEDIFSEITRVSPLYKDISLEDINTGQCMWPYKGEPLRHGMSIEGIEIPDIKSMIERSDRRKIYIGIDDPLFQADSLSRNSDALMSIAPEPYVRISKTLSQELLVANGEDITVQTDYGSVDLSVQIDSDVPRNVILIPKNYNGTGVFEVMKWQMHLVTKSPIMDFTECVIKKRQVEAEVLGEKGVLV